MQIANAMHKTTPAKGPDPTCPCFSRSSKRTRTVLNCSLFRETTWYHGKTQNITRWL